MNPRSFLSRITLLLVAGTAAFTIGCSGHSSGATVRIDGNFPLTGPVASFSGQYGNGLLMGLDDACKELGVARETFQVDLQDNQGRPAEAATIAQRQVISGFDVYISGVSQMSRAVAPIVDPTSAVHFLLSYDAHLTEGAPNRMRLMTHFKEEGLVYVRYAALRQAKRVMSITLNNPEIQGEFSEYVEPGLKSIGTPFQREIYEFDNTDFPTLALKAKAFQPDLIFVSGFSVHVLPIIRALRTQGLVGDGNVLAIMDFNELLGGAAPIGELAGVAYAAPPFSFPENKQAREQWTARFIQRFGKTPNFVPAFGYDTGRLLVHAYVKHGKVTKPTIEAELPFTGVSGPLTVDSTGDLNTPLGVLKVKADGSIERVF